MTTDQWFGLILSGITLLFMAMTAILGVSLRAVVKFTRIEEKQGAMIERMDTLFRDKDQIHREQSNQMRENRIATNSRLEWLERNLWLRGEK